MEQIMNRSKASIWLQAARPFAYSASVIPLLVGGMIALTYYGGETEWWLFPVVIIAGVLFHTATNFISEYYDYKKGVDRDDTFGSSRVIIDGLIEPKKLRNAAYITFAIGFALGLLLVAQHGMPILILGVIGLLGGMFYSGIPFGFKYYGLGDVLVFTMMGPLMVIGSYYALTGDFNANVFYISLPIGFLVTAILHANNIRDIKHDSEARIKTLAMILGIQPAKMFYNILVIGAYVSVIFMVIFGVLEIWTLVVLLSIPVAIKNMKEVSKAKVEKPDEVAMIDIITAQFHMMFGLLYSIGILVSKFL